MPYYLFVQLPEHLLKLYLGNTTPEPLSDTEQLLPPAGRAMLPMFDFDPKRETPIHDQWFFGVVQFLEDQEIDPVLTTRIKDFLKRNWRGVAYMGLG